MGKKDKDRDKEKKHKDKEKDRDRPKEKHKKDKKKHKKHRIRSPSRDRDKDYKRQEDEEPRRKRSRSYDDESEPSIPSKKEHKETDRSEDKEINPPKTSGSVSSLSIEETNKLRLQLGLKPLQIDKPTVSKDTKEISTADITTVKSLNEPLERVPALKTEEIHAPPKNIGEQKSAELLKEKLQTSREARELTKKLFVAKGLADTEEISVTDWVSQMREKDKEKQQAEKRARLLEEMDKDFESEDVTMESRKETKPLYTSTSLSGLRVEHKEDHFREGKEVVLTLKDSNILNDDEDVLMNINMVDDEKAARNVMLKKGVPEYQAYQEEFDEYGNPLSRTLLCKYDEEIEGVKQSTFTLGTEGVYNMGDEQRRKEEARRVLDQKAIRLEPVPLTLASEYYTEEEMVQFKKRKRRKKTAGRLKVEDIVPLPSEELKQDHGSRSATGRHPEEEQMETETQPTDTQLLDDELDGKFNDALQRTRQLLRKRDTTEHQRSSGASHVASVLSARARVKTEKNVEDENAIVLDTTAEFCRQIGEEEEEGKSQAQLVDNDDDDENDMEVGGGDNEDTRTTGGWSEVNLEEEKKAKQPPQYNSDVLQLEGNTSLGVAAALEMATKKGFVEVGREAKKDSGSKTIIDVGVRDWEYERDRGRERERDKDGRGREMPFAEKKGYNPDVSIEYADKLGRLLTPKEAFRELSHKFHGKGSGKKKTEKRFKKMLENYFVNQTSSVDMRFASLEMLQKKQERSQSAYVVLSGGQKQSSLNELDLSKNK